MTDDKSQISGKDTIYVDVEDDITAIINKVEGAREKVVALVLPKRASALQSIVNMRLLMRSAKLAGKQPVLVTSDPPLLPLAGVAGLHVAKNLESKPYIPPSPVIRDETPDIPSDKLDTEPDEADAKLDYHRSIGELAAAGGTDEAEAIALDSGEKETTKPAAVKKPSGPKNKKLAVPNFDKFRLMLGLAIGGVIALIIFIILAVKVLPKATITISTESIKTAASFNLTTDSNAKAFDEAKNIIPSALKTADQTSVQQVQATGQQNNGQKATGTVSVSTICTKVPLPIAKNTGMSSNGLSFVTTDTLTFTVSGSDSNGNITCGGSAPVVATQGGAKYNLAAGSTFTVSGRPETGKNNSAFSGGTDNITTVLSQTDIDNASQKLTAADTDKFGKDFQKQVSDSGLYVISPTYKLGDSQASSSPAIGQPTTTATVTIKITHSVLTLKKDDLKKAVTNELNKQIDLKKQKLSGEDVLKNIQVSVQSQASPTNASLAVTDESTAVPVIDVEAVKKIAAGQKSGDIKGVISVWPGVKNVDVKMSPFWVSKAPKSPGKIHIILQEVKQEVKP